MKFSNFKRYLFIIHLLFINQLLIAQPATGVINGELDLRQSNILDKKVIDLSGNWNFFYQHFIDYKTLQSAQFEQTPILVPVPGVFNSAQIRGKKLKNHSYGTYHLKIFPASKKNLFIRLMGVSSAYKIYANNILLGEVGKIGLSKSDYAPLYKPSVFEIPVSSLFNDSVKSIELLVQVANFHHQNSGIWEITQIGYFEPINKQINNEIIRNALIIGILLIIAFYYLALFFLHREEKSAIYFSIFALIMAIRSATIDNRIILNLWSDFPYQIILRIEYLSAYLNIIFISLFFYHLFKNEQKKIIIQIITITGIIFGIIIIFSPISFFTKLRDLFNLYVILTSAYFAYYSLFKAVLHKEKGAIAAFIGMFIMLGTAITDMIAIIFALSMPQIAPIGLVIYVAMQAIVLAQRFTSTFKDNKKLNEQLNFQNDNLEQIVELRTAELADRNHQLLAAEEELRQNNEELMVLNENIEMQKDNLEKVNTKLLSQAAMADILKHVTDSGLDLYEFLQYVLDTILSLPWLKIQGKGAIFVLNQHGLLQMMASKDLGELTQRCAMLHPGECLCGNTFVNKKIVFEKHISKAHTILPQSYQEHGHYNIPLIFNEKSVGVLTLYIDSTYERNHNDEDFLLLLADVLAAVIQRKKMEQAIDVQSQELHSQNIELRNLKELVEQKEKRLQTIIENQGEGFALLDLKGSFVYTNSAAQQVFDVSRDELLKIPMVHFFNSDDLQEITSIIEKLNNQEKYTTELLAQTNVGDLKFIQLTITTDYDDENQKKGYIVNFRDITEIKKSEQELQNANMALKKYFVAIEQSPLTIVITDPQANIEYVNPAFLISTGYTQEEIKGSPALLKSGKTPRETYQELWQILNNGEIWEGEFINKKKNGLEYFERAIIAPIKDNFGNTINYVAIKEDITNRKANERKIAEQHQQLEKAFRNIKDSINYAQTLQKSLLTLDHEVKFTLKNYHLLFIPRDQVSGDFYYVNKFENQMVLAVGDCTGHGVPGAFLSILSISYLDYVLHALEKIDPAQTLEILRNKIKDTFKNDQNKNGFDIALCVIDLTNNELTYSGAYNPLLIIRNRELLEFKAANCPIGYHPNEKPFYNQTISLLHDDIIYLFSDGFIDQVGGEFNRKFMRKNFYQLLLDISEKPMKEQHESIKTQFKEWKGALSQVDDVTILGLHWE